jgi:L-malate glycosyltransferase
MKILELCVVPALGGLELYFHRCCVALRDKGHHVYSVRLSGSRLEELAKKEAIATVSLQNRNRFFPWTRATQLSRFVEEHQIEILHAHHKDDLALAVLTKKISSRKFKLVFTRQMPMAQDKKDPYHRWLYTNIDLFLTITEQLRNDAIQKLPIPGDRIKRLYYGVPAPPAKDENFLREFMNISQLGDFNIGVFSRLEFQKGQHLVIEALKRVRSKNIPAKLYVVGDVMFQDYKASLLRQMEENGLSGFITFKGFIPTPVLAMQGMDAVILPSRNEAFGLVLIEAMRSGVAVLGVNAGGVPEIIDHEKTGLLFEWDNVAQLSDQLEFLFKNPEIRATLARNGKLKADSEFNSDLHFKRLENLFEELLRS